MRADSRFEDTASLSSSSTRSMSMPHEIQFLVNSAMSVYSAVSGASELPEPRGRSMMASMLPDLSTDTESEASFFTHRSPLSKCLNPVKESQSLPRSPPPPCTNNILYPHLTKTKYFKELVEECFRNLDTNKNGFVDKKELYSGLLLIHLSLSKYAVIAACQPPNCEHVYSVFEEVDVDCTGILNEYQFKEAIAVLSSQILLRVTIQWSIMILIAIPLMLHYLSYKFLYIMKSMDLFQFI